MAVYDDQQGKSLLRDINSDDERVRQMLADIHEQEGIVTVVEKEDVGAQFD